MKITKQERQTEKRKKIEGKKGSKVFTVRSLLRFGSAMKNMMTNTLTGN